MKHQHWSHSRCNVWRRDINKWSLSQFYMEIWQTNETKQDGAKTHAGIISETCCIHMLHSHVAFTCCIHMFHSHVAFTCSASLISDYFIQPLKSSLKCTMRCEQGHSKCWITGNWTIQETQTSPVAVRLTRTTEKLQHLTDHRCSDVLNLLHLL